MKKAKTQLCQKAKPKGQIFDAQLEIQGKQTTG